MGQVSKSLAVVVATTALVVSGLLQAAAGASVSAAAKPRPGGSVTFLQDNEPVAWDGARMGTGSLQNMAYFAYDTLVRVDGEGKLVPHLAQSLTASSGNTVWTLKLRPNLKFTDGTAFDAAAIVTNWDRYKDPATAAQCATQIKSMASYTAVDATTLRITMPQPYAFLPSLLENNCVGSIASPTALAKYGTRYGSAPESTVGAGPFVLKEWVRGDHFTFAKNPGYWDAPRPYLDTVVIKAVPDATQKANTLTTGAADIAFFATPTTQATQLMSQGFTRFARATGLVGIFFNFNRPPFNDARVRSALVLAADLDDMNAKATGGSAAVVTTYFTKDSPYYNPAVKQRTNNLAKAQKLIDSYVAEKGGPVKGTFLLSQNIANFGLPIQQQWARLKNVDIAIDQVLPTQASQASAAKNFDMTYQGVGNGCDVLTNQVRTGSATNYGSYSNSEVDSELTECLTTANVAKRKAALDKVTETLFSDAFALFTHRNFSSTLVSKRLHGVALVDDPNASYADLTNAWLSAA
jgi:ABC-type transport system substrate-binding protein